MADCQIGLPLTVQNHAYLLSEAKVDDADKIVIMGDSAGGHLALTFLVDRLSNGSGIKSRGLILLSPWLSLHTYSEPAKANERSDALSVAFITRLGRLFRGLPTSSSFSDKDYNPLLEFLAPKPEIDWREVLPEWTWVCGAEREVLSGQIVEWVEKARVKGANVEIEVERAKTHDWQRISTQIDEEERKRWLGGNVGDESEFEDVRAVALVLAERIKVGK